jgi:NHS family xanthosine MFS transporter
MIMTNGLGAFIGGITSGWLVDYFTVNGIKDWPSIWFAFAGYALMLGVIFPFVFKYKHKSKTTVLEAESTSITG